MNALHRHPDNTDIQELGREALDGMTFNNEANKQEIIKQGGRKYVSSQF